MNQALNDNPIKGIVFYLLSILFYGLITAITRHLGSIFPAHEIVFFRSIITTICLSAFIFYQKEYFTLSPRKLILYFVIIILGFIAILTSTASFMHLALADASTISFTLPLFIILLSYFFISEQISLYRWISIIFGFLGVLVAFNPAFVVFNIGLVYGLVSAFLQALIALFMRKISKEEHHYSTVFYFSLGCTFFSGIGLFFDGVKPNFEHMLFFISLGLLNLFSQVTLVLSYKYASSVVLSPFYYLSLILATILGYFFWGDIPSISLIIGGSIIILSTAYLFYKEYKKRNQKVNNSL